MDYEAKLQRFYEAILIPGMTAIDVGAHLGRHAFEMARLVGVGGTVYAYEPVPSLFEQLQTTIVERSDLRDIVRAFPFALSKNEGMVEFCLAVDAPAYSGLRERVYDTPTRIQRISVECRRLDDLIGEEIPVNYIKIDTEGAEWDVIQGAKTLIGRCHPYISFEFGENSYRNYGVEPNEVFDWFLKMDYKLFDINGKTLSQQEFGASAVHQSVWDYVASPDKKAIETSSILCQA